MSSLITRNVTASSSKRTSMRLEPEFWSALEEIIEREGGDISKLVRRIHSESTSKGGRTTAVRVYLLRYFRAAATEPGHKAAGHGSLVGSKVATQLRRAS